MIAAKVASSGALQRLATEWRMPMELATDLVRSVLSEALGLMGRSRSRCLTLFCISMIRGRWHLKKGESGSMISNCACCQPRCCLCADGIYRCHRLLSYKPTQC